ncbi:MAG: hypothetical protein KF862_13475 [Chitinophagaceae bacterium]|nr:hypothetical protein [Chitinophagaceae bacterium]
MKIFLTYMGIVLATAGVFAQDLKTKREKKKIPIDVYILAGQSNAVGFNNAMLYEGGIGKFNKKFTRHSKVLLWAGSNAREGYANKWSNLQIGISDISVEIAYKHAFGPEIGFAQTMSVKMPGKKIAIIKYAVGGTGIARSSDYNDYIPSLKDYDDKDINWHYPGLNSEAGVLYKNLFKNIQAAIDSLKKINYSCNIAGFIWMQGEHEAGISPTMANDYKDLLFYFFNSVRRDLNLPKLPVVIGGVNMNTWAFGDLARQRQAEYCSMDPYSKLVTTTGLSRNGNGDTAHFDAEGMLLLGQRFAQQMLVLLKKR